MTGAIKGNDGGRDHPLLPALRGESAVLLEKDEERGGIKKQRGCDGGLVAAMLFEGGFLSNLCRREAELERVYLRNSRRVCYFPRRWVMGDITCCDGDTTFALRCFVALHQSPLHMSLITSTLADLATKAQASVAWPKPLSPRSDRSSDASSLAESPSRPFLSLHSAHLCHRFFTTHTRSACTIIPYYDPPCQRTPCCPPPQEPLEGERDCLARMHNCSCPSA